MPRPIALFVLSALLASLAAAEPTSGRALLSSEFIFSSAPFPSCHASTLAATPAGLVSAFFAGQREGAPDVAIWLSRQDPATHLWSAPTQVAKGIDPTDGKTYPCWNPVLFQVPPHANKPGPLLLFYKVGPKPHSWWGMLTTSTDNAQSFAPPRRLPENILGPVKDKPTLLEDGTLLCPSSTEHAGWQLHMEFTEDLGQSWQSTPPLNDGKTIAAIQPTILIHPNHRLQLLCRTKQGFIATAFSQDTGHTWSELQLTTLPNPNSGIDAVTLKDGRHLLVYNHTKHGRSPLNTAVSTDGLTWKAGPTLESSPGEYSYPAVIQTPDGLVHITYTWQRKRIKHVTLDPAKLTPTDLPQDP